MTSRNTFYYDDAAISYWSYHENNPTTIVMIHGFRGTHHGLLKIVEKLPNFHIIVPDLPGFGASDAFKTKPHSLESYVDFLHHFMTHLKLSKPPTLLGHSFGSIIASHYAAITSAKIDKLILINPIGAPALQGQKAILTKLAVFYYLIGRKLPPNLAARWLGNELIVRVMSESMTESRRKTMRKFVHNQHRQYFSRFAHPKVVAESFNASVSHDVMEVASKISQPTLIIAGEQDDITPIKTQYELATKIKDSQLHAITNVGHLIHYETSDEAADAIFAFLRSETRP